MCLHLLARSGSQGRPLWGSFWSLWGLTLASYPFDAAIWSVLALSLLLNWVSLYIPPTIRLAGLALHRASWPPVPVNFAEASTDQLAVYRPCFRIFMYAGPMAPPAVWFFIRILHDKLMHALHGNGIRHSVRFLFMSIAALLPFSFRPKASVSTVILEPLMHS